MQFQITPKRQSPLQDRHQSLEAQFSSKGAWLVPEVYTDFKSELSALQESIGIADITAMGKLTVRGQGAADLVELSLGIIPARPGEINIIESKGVIVAYLYHDEFFIFTPPGEEKNTAESLGTRVADQDSLITVVDNTSGLVGLSLSGPNSRSVMRKLCALSLDEKQFPNMRAAQTSFAKVRTTILRRDIEKAPRYDLFAERSYGEYLWDSILDAGMEFGIQPVGWQALEISG